MDLPQPVITFGNDSNHMDGLAALQELRARLPRGNNIKVIVGRLLSEQRRLRARQRIRRGV